MERTFSEWIQSYTKPKYYIYTSKEKQYILDACMALQELHLYMKVELQEISPKKAVEILECKYHL
jgi:hypothetical protein